LLINPGSRYRQGFRINRATRNQPLSLGILAALCPPHYHIKIIDENFRQFRYYDADLVAITAFTATAPRAYEIARLYREKGIPVVIGGIHASLLPEEAGRYADVVVTGEAESVWREVLSDFEAGRLKPVYNAGIEPLIRQPLPRRDLFHPAYIAASVQTSRGCPMDCSFCSVSAFNGRHYRFRPIADVLDELECIPQDYVFFVDDNITGYSTASRDRAGELFEGILSRGIRKTWISQAGINFADDEKLLRLAARSGCRMIFLGVETEGEEQLIEAGKVLNLKKGVDSYNAVFKKIQKHGIGVIGGFIYGWDSETPETMQRRTRFIRQSNASSFQVSVLTPLPGTRLFDKYRSEGRLLYNDFPDDWKRYDYYELVTKHPIMDAVVFEKEMQIALKRIYAPWQVLKKTLLTLFFSGKWVTASILGLNYWHYRRIFLMGRQPLRHKNQQ